MLLRKNPADLSDYSEGVAITVENRVGRLIELRVGPILSSEEFAAAMATSAALMQKLARPVVGVNDCRQAVALPPSLALTVIRAMRTNTPFVERAALLVPPSNLLMLQAEHVVE